MSATVRPVRCSLPTRMILSLAGFALAGFWLVARADEPRSPASRATPQALPEGFPLDVECTLSIARGQVQETLSGRIQKVTDDWIVLEDKAGSATMAGVPILNKVPYISRQFKNTGVPSRAREIWIPRGNLLYLSVDQASPAGAGTSKDASTAQIER